MLMKFRFQFFIVIDYSTLKNFFFIRKELGFILWRDGEQKDNEYVIFPYSKDKVNENMMYHPIKDLKRQIKLRFGDESIKDKDR